MHESEATLAIAEDHVELTNGLRVDIEMFIQCVRV